MTTQQLVEIAGIQTAAEVQIAGLLQNLAWLESFGSPSALCFGQDGRRSERVRAIHATLDRLVVNGFFGSNDFRCYYNCDIMIFLFLNSIILINTRIFLFFYFHQIKLILYSKLQIWFQFISSDYRYHKLIAKWWLQNRINF